MNVFIILSVLVIVFGVILLVASPAAHTQGRWISIHTEEYQKKMAKKDRGYY